MNKIQKVWLTAVAALAWIWQVFAWIDTGLGKVATWVKWNENSLDIVIQGYVSALMWFLWLLAVLLVIYWGFLILTAAWDDAKVKKWKQIMFQAALGLFVIFIAYSLVSWIVWILFK